MKELPTWDDSLKPCPFCGYPPAPFKDTVKVKGHLYIILNEPGKEPVTRDLGDNLVVNNGLNTLGLVLSGNFSNKLNLAQIGVSTTPAAKTDTQLGVTWTQATTPTFVAISSGVTATAVWGAQGSVIVITEFGLLGNGLLYNHIVFAAQTVGATTAFTFKLDVTFG